MTFVTHAVLNYPGVPAGTQPGDFLVVITPMDSPRRILADTSWLRHIGMGVFAGTYPSGGILNGLEAVVVLVYRPDPGEEITVLVEGSFTNPDATKTVVLPNTGDLWGVFTSVISSPTWQGNYSPSAYHSFNQLAYARLPGISSGAVALSAARSSRPYSLGIAVYPATGARPDPSAWTQAMEGNIRVLVGGTDVSAHVISAEVVDELDAPGPTATLVVDRDALHPDLPSSPLQLAAPVEIIGLYRPLGAPKWQEAPMLVGRVGAIDPSRHEMLVQVYDASEALLSTWFEGDLEIYGTERLAMRLSRLLYNAMVPAAIYEESIITVGGAQRFGRRPIWEMMRESAAYCGGSRIRWRYDYRARTWRLVLYTPNRNPSTPDYVFGTNDIIDLGTTRLGLEDVRNVVEVVYGPPTKRNTLTATAPDSIARYGRRVTRIEEASDSVVDTQEEAQALAAAILADLSQPMRGARLSLPWAPFVRVHDVVRILPDGHALKAALQGGVSRVRHRISRDEARTELEVQGNRNPGLYRYWLSHEAGRPGVVSSTVNWRPPVPVAPSSVQAVSTPKGILVTWSQERDPHYVDTIIHFGTNAMTEWGRVSGTSALITALADGTPLTPGATYYVSIAHRYSDGRTSPQTPPVAVVASELATASQQYVQSDTLWSPSQPGTWEDVPSSSLSITVSVPSIVLLSYLATTELGVRVLEDTTSPTEALVLAHLRLVQTSGPTIPDISAVTESVASLGTGSTTGTHLGVARSSANITYTLPLQLQPGTYAVKLQALYTSITRDTESVIAYIRIGKRLLWAFAVPR